MTAQVLPAEVRTDADNPVTTATKTTFPERKETVHIIKSLRTEACSGQADDLAHVTANVQTAHYLTKDKPTKGLQQTFNAGKIAKVDMHPPFRAVMLQKHKAYVAHLLTTHIRRTESFPEGMHGVSYFLMELAKAAGNIVLYGHGISTSLGTFTRLFSGVSFISWTASQR